MRIAIFQDGLFQVVLPEVYERTREEIFLSIYQDKIHIDNTLGTALVSTVPTSHKPYTSDWSTSHINEGPTASLQATTKGPAAGLHATN